MERRPWLASYSDGVPEEIDIDEYRSLIEMFENSMRDYSDQAAFENMGTVMTFRSLEEYSRAFAAYLQNELKLNKGDRVAIMMPNVLQYPVALLGVLRAGLIAVGVNPLYTPRELECQLNDSGASTIIVISDFAKTLEKIVENTSVENVILTSLGQMLPKMQGTEVDLLVKYVKRVVPKYDLPGAISFRKALSRGRRLQYVKPLMSGEDIAFLQYTGGATGIEKGVILTHQNMVANVLQAKAMYGSALNKGREKIVTALPLCHIFALTVNFLLFIELGGKNILVTNPKDIPNLVEELKNTRFTVFTGVNTLFHALINNQNFQQLDFSSLKLAIGGMFIERSVAEEWERLTGVPLAEGYGVTECSPLVSVNPYNLAKHNGSIGMPVPSTDIRIVNDKGELLPIGQAGELQVAGPQVMQGYWQDPEATNNVISRDGWLSTGDIVKMDERGYLTVIDRKKDLILVSGFNVYPKEIEEVIVQHNKVLDAVVIGVPREVSGEMIKAFIVKKDPSVTEHEIIEHCRKLLTDYKIPKVIEFRDELPKDSTGKVLCHELIKMDEQRK